MSKTHYKFKTGQRVIYRCRGMGGNGLRDGDHGKVVARQSFRDQNDYIVKFDRFSPEYMDLKNFKIPDGYGWPCTEEHLDSEDGSDEEDDPDIKKQKKEEENTMAKRINWAKADFIIRDERKKGTTLERIAEILGCSKDSVRIRCKKLNETGFICQEEDACEESEEEERPELNELEAALAEVISEQKEEIDYLQGRVRGLETEVETRTEEAMEAKRLVVKKEERIKKLEYELEGVKEALRVAEASVGEERQAEELLVKEFSAAREALESREKDCMDGIRDTLARYDARIKEISDERDRYLRLAIRLSESVVGL